MKTKVESREGVRDRLEKWEGGGEPGVQAVRAVWQPERHDGKLCGTEEQAQPSIRSSCGRLWRGDKTHQLSPTLSPGGTGLTLGCL